jgi:O-antigen/teichoic acid export membrane protein
MVSFKQMLKDVGVLIRGSVFAQIIGIMIIPLLSRLYSPADFGAFGLFQAAMVMISVVACLRYDQAILTAENKADAFGLFRLCLCLSFVMSLVVLLAVSIVKIFGLEQSWLGPLSLYWLSPATFIAGMALAVTSLFTWLGAFHMASNSRIIQSAANGFTAITFGLVSPAAWGLVLADTIGKLAVILFGTKVLLPSISWRAWRAWLHDSPTLARRYVRFPKLSVVGALLNNGGFFVTRVALFNLFGAEANGQFALADRLIALPLGLVIVALSQVFTSHFSRLLREDRIGAGIYLRSTVRYAALVGLLPLIIGTALAPQIFIFILGPQWTEAGEFAQILAVMYYSSIVSGPIQTALVVNGRMAIQFAYEALSVTLLIALWSVVAWQECEITTALIGLALITAVTNFIYVWFAWFGSYGEKTVGDIS